MSSFIQLALGDAEQALKSFIGNTSNTKFIEQAVSLFVQSLEKGGRILSCGNGGSMCDSLHFAEELTGRFRKDRRALSAIPMGDPGHITCVANDFGYQHVFSRNVEAWGRKGDSLLSISTSGNSENVILATQTAKKMGMNVVGLLGNDGGKLKDLVDVPIIVDHKITDRIQEIHIKIIHIMIEGIERQLFPEHYR